LPREGTKGKGEKELRSKEYWEGGKKKGRKIVQQICELNET
jgi:hypothetical protein